MKMRETLLGPIVLSLLVAMTAALLGGANPVGAQTATTTTTTTTGAVVNTTVVPIGGTVDGKGVESVSISGNLLMTCTMVKDPDFKTPASMRHQIDFSNVTGTGLKSGAVYVIGTEIDIKIRPVVKSDVIEITFPLFATSAGMLTARAGLATIVVMTNGAGTVTSVTATAGTPAF